MTEHDVQSPADEIAILLIAQAIRDVKAQNHSDACANFEDGIKSLRGNILARAKDYLFSAWLKQKTQQYLVKAWPQAAKRYEELNEGGPLPKYADGKTMSAEVLVDNTNFDGSRDCWFERHSATLRALVLEEQFELAVAGAMWVCQNLFAGFADLGRLHKE